MKRRYLCESHRKVSEACQKEVAEMCKHPLTAEQKEAQMLRNRRKYLSEAHRLASEVLQRAVDEMAKQPLTRKEMKEQCERNKSLLNKK